MRLQHPEQRVSVLSETLFQHTRWILVVPFRAPSDICQSHVRQIQSEPVEIELLKMSPVWDFSPLVLKHLGNRALPASVRQDQATKIPVCIIVPAFSRSGVHQHDDCSETVPIAFAN